MLLVVHIKCINIIMETKGQILGPWVGLRLGKLFFYWLGVSALE